MCNVLSIGGDFKQISLIEIYVSADLWRNLKPIQNANEMEIILSFKFF
jgi:hypothetical protein